MENKEVKEVIKNKTSKPKPFTFISITLKLFFIDSFNKIGSAIAKNKIKRKIKKQNKKQVTDL